MLVAFKILFSVLLFVAVAPSVDFILAATVLFGVVVAVCSLVSSWLQLSSLLHLLS